MIMSSPKLFVVTKAYEKRQVLRRRGRQCFGHGRQINGRRNFKLALVLWSVRERRPRQAHGPADQERREDHQPAPQYRHDEPLHGSWVGSR